jgi:hypothetical protein
LKPWERTVRHLIQKLETLTNIPAEVQRLYHEGKLLEVVPIDAQNPERLLEDFGVVHESTVHLSLVSSTEFTE